MADAPHPLPSPWTWLTTPPLPAPWIWIRPLIPSHHLEHGLRPSPLSHHLEHGWRPSPPPITLNMAYAPHPSHHLEHGWLPSPLPSRWTWLTPLTPSHHVEHGFYFVAVSESKSTKNTWLTSICHLAYLNSNCYGFIPIYQNDITVKSIVVTSGNETQLQVSVEFLQLNN